MNSEFLRIMLASPGLRSQADRAARGVAQKTVNLADIKMFKVFAPPLDVQHQFVSHVKECQRMTVANTAALSLTRFLFASLQHRAFRGEL